jgi:hypothetical protein
MNRLVFFFAVFFLSVSVCAQDPVATDVSHQPDFQFVVKVLGISNDEAAIERLSLSWRDLNALLSQLRPTLASFEAIRRAASFDLKGAGTEIGLQAYVALVRGIIVDVSIGYLEKGTKVRPHLRIGFQLPWGAGLAAGVLRRDTRADPYPLGLDSRAVMHSGGFLGVGGLHANADEFEERSFGVGLAFASDSNPAYSVHFPLFWKTNSGAANRIRNIEKLVRQLIVHFQNFELNEIREKVEIFEDQVRALSTELETRWKRREPGASLSELHPLASIQNLFEPGMYETDLKTGKVCVRQLKRIAKS